MAKKTKKQKGTRPTQLRLTPEDLAAIQKVRDHFRFPSLAAAVRYAVGQFADTLPEPEKKTPKKSKDGG
jgi:hypothetical protein